jgi:hypothetical protein
MSFYICHCGYTENNHHFKHPFEKLALVKRDLNDDGNEVFIVNSDNFLFYDSVRCKKENCILKEKLHETDIVNHKYVPERFSFKKLNFALPSDAICHYKDCVSYENHKNIITHRFQTKIIFKNKNKDDIIQITNSEYDDIKIKFD